MARLAEGYGPQGGSLRERRQPWAGAGFIAGEAAGYRQRSSLAARRTRIRWCRTYTRIGHKATVRIVDGDIEDARQLARQIADSEGAFLVEDSVENIDTCGRRRDDQGSRNSWKASGPSDAVKSVHCARRRRATCHRLCGLRLQVSGSAGRNRGRAAEASAGDGVVMAGRDPVVETEPHRWDDRGRGSSAVSRSPRGS